MNRLKKLLTYATCALTVLCATLCFSACSITTKEEENLTPCDIAVRIGIDLEDDVIFYPGIDKIKIEIPYYEGVTRRIQLRSVKILGDTDDMRGWLWTEPYHVSSAYIDWNLFKRRDNGDGWGKREQEYTDGEYYGFSTIAERGEYEMRLYCNWDNKAPKTYGNPFTNKTYFKKRDMTLNIIVK